jgi:sensor c-di-GMP phosphodiesterase-like protein
MAEQIIDGTGTGKKAKIDSNNQMHTFSITEDEQRAASRLGNEYNINTGTIAYTGTSESSMIYFKNDEDTDYIITAVAVGLGTRSVTVTDAAVITIVKNPTGGDVITDATAVSINSNTNFGSSKTLKSTTLAYKGKDGGTITGGTEHAILYMTDGRLYASLNIEIPRGSSLGIKIDLNTSGGANAYAALIGYLKDVNNE